MKARRKHKFGLSSERQDKPVLWWQLALASVFLMTVVTVVAFAAWMGLWLVLGLRWVLGLRK